jgi:cation diffusion facilitator family transporter
MNSNTGHAQLRQRAFRLSIFTVAYNVLEGVASIVAGVLAGSTALVGFGSDSFVESLSGTIMLWRFRERKTFTHEEEKKLEAKATRLIGIAFMVLAAYIIFESAKKLYFREPPDASLFGIMIAIASLIVMPLLYIAKKRTAHRMASRSLMADSKQTLACVLLSIALLLGLTMNYLYRWWWADPVAGLVIAAFLVREGYEAIKNKEFCC